MNKMEQMNMTTFKEHFKGGTLDKVVFNDKSKATFNGLTFLVDSVDTAKGIVGLKVINYYVNADRIDWEKTSLLVNKVNKVNDTIPEEDKDQIEPEPLELGNATLTTLPTSIDPTELHDKIKWLELACELHMMEHHTIYDEQAIYNNFDRHVEKQRKAGNEQLKASYDKVVAENERYKKMLDVLMETPAKNGGIGLGG